MVDGMVWCGMVWYGIDIYGSCMDIYGSCMDIYGSCMDIYGSCMDIYGSCMDIYGSCMDIDGKENISPRNDSPISNSNDYYHTAAKCRTANLNMVKKCHHQGYSCPPVTLKVDSRVLQIPISCRNDAAQKKKEKENCIFYFKLFHNNTAKLQISKFCTLPKTVSIQFLQSCQKLRKLELAECLKNAESQRKENTSPRNDFPVSNSNDYYHMAAKCRTTHLNMVIKCCTMKAISALQSPLKWTLEFYKFP
ncbi:hypothetical protein CEXT_777991 [Caerostris extrusa]|uniref:FZ domain-containing protein n=1 Tax=Caerostris extrusa TaxID=172846 RepID=A0AAV4M815_CAEEX|nr:hypothetical protein CEXT_777991 [Caerostris extrusa]